MALVAMAASMALPPCSRIDAPTCDESTLSLATIPVFEYTMDRDCERSWAATESTISRAATPYRKGRFIARMLGWIGRFATLSAVCRNGAKRGARCMERLGALSLQPAEPR